MIPARVKASAGLVRAFDFRPTPHGRQTIACARPARIEDSEEPGAFNGIIVGSHETAEDLTKHHATVRLLPTPHYSPLLHCRSLPSLSPPLPLTPLSSLLFPPPQSALHTQRVNLFFVRPISDFETLSWQQLPDGVEDIIVQGVLPETVVAPSPAYPLLQTNLDEAMNRFALYGPEFAREYLETTRGWPCYWLNDREIARRPWIKQVREGKRQRRGAPHLVCVTLAC